MIRPREGSPVPEFCFRPTGLYVEPGDTVKWSLVTGHHTVSAYHPEFGFRRRRAARAAEATAKGTGVRTKAEAARSNSASRS